MNDFMTNSGRYSWRYFLLTALLMLQYSSLLHALEIDDVITLRILKTSSSKKTVLTNRGAQDGLQIGQHAKFSSESGVVARGVVMEITDERSIWSLYRVSNPDLVESDTLLNAKISEPMKITTDDTKTLIREDSIADTTPNRGAELSLPLEDISGELPEGAYQSPKEMSIVDQANIAGAVDLRDYPRELLARISLQTLNSKTKANGGSGSDYAGNVEMTNFLMGAEFYFKNPDDHWYGHFSFLPYIQYQYQSTLSYEGSIADTKLWEAGLGMQCYMYSPHRGNKFNPYGEIFFAKGRVDDHQAGGERAAGNGVEVAHAQGTATAYGGGIGIKYFFVNRLAFNILAEYYLRTDTFERDENNLAWERTLSGPRLQIGLGYRF